MTVKFCAEVVNCEVEDISEIIGKTFKIALCLRAQDPRIVCFGISSSASYDFSHADWRAHNAYCSGSYSSTS